MLDKRAPGLHEIVFQTTEKEEAEVELMKRDEARGRAAVEMMPLKPWGRYPEGGRSYRDHPHPQRGSAVMESERTEISAGHEDRHAGQSNKDPRLEFINEKGTSLALIQANL